MCSKYYELPYSEYSEFCFNLGFFYSSTAVLNWSLNVSLQILLIIVSLGPGQKVIGVLSPGGWGLVRQTPETVFMTVLLA